MVGWTHFKQYSLEMVINPVADKKKSPFPSFPEQCQVEAQVNAMRILLEK